MALDPKEVLHDVGRRIAELRTARGLTQEQLATRAGIGWKYFQQIESGSENLTLRSLVRLANLLDVSMAELMKPPATREVRPGRPAREKPLKTHRGT